MTAHTPGPWHVHASGSQRFCKPTVWADGPVAVMSMARVARENIKALTLEESQANARLIAAAPDLLAALQDIERDADYGAVRDGLLTIIRDKARTAIGRATS